LEKRDRLKSCREPAGLGLNHRCGVWKSKDGGFVTIMVAASSTMREVET
jgi:hypothetical protein